MKTRLFGKRDIARIRIDHEYAVSLQLPDDGLNFGPACSELLLFLGLSFGEYLFREIKRAIKEGAAKIEG